MFQVSNSIPIQFWPIGEITYNEKEILGVQKRCFCQPLQCADTQKVVHTDTVSRDYRVRVLDSEGGVLTETALTEIVDGSLFVYSLDFANLNSYCGQKVSMIIGYDDTPATTTTTTTTTTSTTTTAPPTTTTTTTTTSTTTTAEPDNTFNGMNGTIQGGTNANPTSLGGAGFNYSVNPIPIGSGTPSNVTGITFPAGTTTRTITLSSGGGPNITIGTNTLILRDTTDSIDYNGVVSNDGTPFVIVTFTIAPVAGHVFQITGTLTYSGG